MKIAVLLFSGLLLGCHGHPLTIPEQADAGTPPIQDASPSPADLTPIIEAPYPAPHPDLPQVVSQGGPILAAPQFVAVTFDEDPLRDQLESFVEAIGGTEYWKTIASEYGVGAATYAGAVHLKGPAPAMLADDPSDLSNPDTIAGWLAAQLDGTHTDWPAPVKDSTLYVVFYPESTVVTLTGSRGDSQSCMGFGAYHSEALLPSGDPVPYAVVPRCGRGAKDLATVTSSTSHEMVEAATDPYPGFDPAYSNVDKDHIAWAIFGGGENADMCTGTDRITPTGFDYVVQRNWSNQAAKAGHNPCVPAPDEVYFNAGVVIKDKISITGGRVGGVRIPVGKSKTVEVDLFSDRPTDGEWNVSIGSFRGSNNLSASLDRDTGRNGDKLMLTITVNQPNTGRFGAGLVTLVSTLGNRRTTWPFFVGQ